MSDIETVNDQIVAVRGYEIVCLAPKRIMTREEALRQAAWLVTMAGMLDDEADDRFKQILQAVRNS